MSAKPVALWQPDASADTCQRCAAEFSVVLRRHHCRNCGLLVCYTCSESRAHVKGYDGVQRVCNECCPEYSAAKSLASPTAKNYAVARTRRRTSSSLVGGVVKSPELPPGKASPLGWYSGTGGAAGLTVRVEVEQRPAGERAAVFIWSSSPSLFEDRGPLPVSIAVLGDGKLAFGPGLLAGLKGTVVTSVGGSYDAGKAGVNPNPNSITAVFAPQLRSLGLFPYPPLRQAAQRRHY